MTEFTASNGYRVIANEGGTVQFIGPEPFTSGIIQVFPGSEWWDALREFFQQEHPDLVAARARWQSQEDARLGRWRWPENPEYVVYPDRESNYIEQPAVIVVNEKHGGNAYVSATGSSASGIAAADALIFDAAQAYFDAHPEPKPWHDAKPGEVWEITFDEIFPSQRSGTTVFWVAEDDDSTGGIGFVPSDSATPRIGTQAVAITAGRRIWPEATS